ncbi:ureidoglycolate dehydrogenase [Escherichia coli]|uniref:Ureidoglycolate dehydrogenase n=1 Tax=Escherichia coli TaxID=562 RepID=A0A485JIL5_ECOLX|nr:ureidoglycolate dehydrogenase [Escherichia coli]
MSTLQPWLKYWFTPMPEDPLSWRGARGYYAERISKGGTNREPEFRLEETGPCSAILHADNAAGQVAAKMGMEHAIKTAQQNGVAVVGISRMGHSGAISYLYSRQLAQG